MLQVNIRKKNYVVSSTTVGIIPYVAKSVEHVLAGANWNELGWFFEPSKNLLFLA